MKKFLLAIFALWLLPLGLLAADGSFTGLTNNVLGLATNAVASTSARVGRGTVCVFVAFTSTNATSTGDLVFEFGRSVDDISWTKGEAQLTFTNTLAGASTNQVIAGEVAMAGAQYLRLNSIANRGTNAAYGVDGISAKWYYARSP